MLLEERVTEFIHRHQLLTEGSTVFAGVSGGPDSLALLHFLKRMRKRWRFKLHAISIDHGLRGDASRDDKDFVGAVCSEWDIAFTGITVDVPAYQKQKHLSTQVAARDLRYRCFREQMEKQGGDALVLGHHGDDQVETMLMAFLRAGDPDALSGIPVKRPFAGGQIIRPFLGISKDDIEAYCEAHNLQPRRDPSNMDTAYTRNAIRQEIIPYMKRFNSSLHSTLQHRSEVMQVNESYLQEKGQAIADAVVTYGADGKKAFFDRQEFLVHPHALQRQVYHLILKHLYEILPKNLSYVHEGHFFRLLSGTGNDQVDFPGDLIIRREYEDVTFYFLDSDTDGGPFSISINIPGKTHLPDGAVIDARWTRRYDPSDYTYAYPEEALRMPLTVRTRKPGDRMHWKGLGGTKKLKDVFIDHKISPRQRDAWPLVVDAEGTVLWLIGLKKRSFSEAANRQYLQLTYEKPAEGEEYG